MALYDVSPGAPDLFSGAHVNSSATISVPNGGATWTSITFDTEDYDTDNYHSTSSNTSRLTAVKAGYHAFGGSFSYTSNSTGARFIRLQINGSTLLDSFAGNALNGFETPVAVAGQYRLAVGDFVEIQGYQNSGGALTVSVTNYRPLFWIAYLGS